MIRFFGEQVQKLANNEVKDEIFKSALSKKVEADVYKILTK
jgi:hypothetical protein